MPEWTKAQKDAIDSRRGSILVSAAAGSGKTAVLVERIIQRLTDKENATQADRLLVVTFTKAAAAEMRARIDSAIAEAIKADPDNAALRRQQILLNQADICTVDSFCSQISREFFYKLGINADFKITDDKQREDLESQAMEITLNSAFENGFPELAEFFSSERNDKGLSDAIMTLYSFTRSHIFPEQWLEETVESYDSSIPVRENKWCSCLIDYAIDILEYAHQSSIDSMRLIREDDKLSEKLTPVIAEDISVIEKLMEVFRNDTWDKMSEAVSVGKKLLGSFPVIRGYKDDPIKVRVQNTRNAIKDSLDQLYDLFSDSEEEVREQIDAMKPLTKQLADLVLDFTENYNRLKREKNLADYSDIEHWTVELFMTRENGKVVPTELAAAVGSRYDEIMIDEYQDTNDVQDKIFRAISQNEKNLFMVGDVKQSIYSFRQAMPEIFVNYKNSIEQYDREMDNYPAYISLDRNFRSREQVINSVNFVFSNLMSPELGGVEYIEGESLVQGASFEEKNCCDTMVDFLDQDGFMSVEKGEAIHIAGIIKEMIAQGVTVTEKGKERPACYNDFCILLRSSNKYAHNYADELAKCGIPAWAAVSGGFFAAPEVLEVLSFLEVIDNPNQDIPLLSVMMSPVYGMTADDAAALRLEDRKDSIYVAMLQSKDPRFSAILEDLEHYRKIAAAMPSDEFITYFYSRTGFLDIVSAMNDGESRVANLRRLRQYAGDYEAAGYVGVSGFVRFMRKLREAKSDLESANLISENADVVRVMSIHKSKGLEFPFCIIAGCGRKFVQDRSDIVLNPKMGFGTKLWRNGAKYTNVIRDAINIENEKNAASEELRVFYVAMTRAKEKLIMISTVKNADKAFTDIASRITDPGPVKPFISGSVRSISQWLMMCALKHPGGENLRHRINADDGIISYDNFTPWEIRVIPTLNLSCEAEAPEKIIPDADFDLVEDIERKCSFKYPDTELNNIPAKVTASALSGESSEIILQRPAFMSQKGLTPAERGTSLHKFMQFCDFAKAAENPEEELNRLVTEKFMTKAQANVVELGRVKKFFASSLGKRILSSPVVKKEQRFSVNIPAGTLPMDISGNYKDVPVILQGAVDCWFEEKGKIYIIDFKTDRMSSLSEIGEKYALQLTLYRQALEKITDKTVGGCYIYSFKFNDFYKVE